MSVTVNILMSRVEHSTKVTLLFMMLIRSKVKGQIITNSPEPPNLHSLTQKMLGLFLDSGYML